MKKLLMIAVVALLVILVYFLIMQHISLFNWKSSSIEDIKNKDSELDDQIAIAQTKAYQEYPESIEKLDNAIKKLETTKENYQRKANSVSGDIELGVVKLKEYKIQRLWVTLGNYAKKENVELKLDLVETSTTDVYNLNITLAGTYMDITNFLYDIEKDDTLNFKILNFAISSSGTTVTTTSTSDEDESSDNDEESISTTTTRTSSDRLTATFEIPEVGIELN